MDAFRMLASLLSSSGDDDAATSGAEPFLPGGEGFIVVDLAVLSVLINNHLRTLLLLLLLLSCERLSFGVGVSLSDFAFDFASRLLSTR